MSIINGFNEFNIISRYIAYVKFYLTICFCFWANFLHLVFTYRVQYKCSWIKFKLASRIVRGASFVSFFSLAVLWSNVPDDLNILCLFLPVALWILPAFVLRCQVNHLRPFETQIDNDYECCGSMTPSHPQPPFTTPCS